MYPFDRAPFWRVCKLDIKAYVSAFATAEPITFPTKYSAPLIELNKNAVYDLTTALATELACKHRCAEVTSAAQAERVSGSDS